MFTRSTTKLRVLARVLVFHGIALAVAPFALLALLLAGRHRSELLDVLLHRGVLGAFWLWGFEPAVVGAPPPADTGPLLIVANHKMGMDTAVVERYVRARSLGKDRVSRWPIFGRLARARGTVFINKEGGGSRASALRSIEAVLRGGDRMIVFPEGLMQPGDEVAPFHRGSFSAAKGFEVLCIGLAYPPGLEWRKLEPMPAHMWKLLWRGRIPVGVAIGEPMTIVDDAAEAAAEAHRVTSELVVQARAALEARAC